MDPVSRIAHFFQSLAPADLPRLPQFYTEDAAFSDPFCDVKGLPAIRAIYEHMFESLDAPRFAVRQCVVNRPDVVVLWDFSFRAGESRTARIAGASHLRLAADGRIAEHRDYWDASELYANIPFLGPAVRWLKRRSAPPSPSRS